MPVKVKNISLWRKEVENKPGALAKTIEPLAKTGADLHVVMGTDILETKPRQRLNFTL